MEHLYHRYLEYKQALPDNKYENLKSGQKPQSVLITCSDSRVFPSEFTGSGPGDTFVIRNAGNFIAAYSSERSTSEAASLEYAVEILNVEEVVVCGHLGCGAVELMQKKLSERMDDVPSALKLFLNDQFKDVNLSNFQQLSAEELVKENVTMQVNNILSYPFIQNKLQQNKLTVWGWVFDFVDQKIIEKIQGNI